jgi:hypothetical protein
MILHPGILALIIGSTIVFVMMLYASIEGIRILAGWDFRSSSERQLDLERKTYLISTIIKYALGFEILSTLLFIYTVDDIHTLFVGAMCATGSLNANPVGWYALYSKIIVFFSASLWIVLNNLDQKAEDFPLIRPKYAALIFIAILIGFDLFFQMRYFLGLSPEVITSCCGSLFSDTSSGIAGELSSLSLRPMMGLFYATVVVFMVAALLCIGRTAAVLRYVVSLLSIVLFCVSIAAIVSFISLYIYELPSHHCPFDIFQKNYHFIGYPIYLSLFCGVFFGILPGFFQPLKKIVSLRDTIILSEKKWLLLSILFILIFTAISSWPVVFGNFTMRGY